MYRLTSEPSRSIQSLKEHSVHGNRTRSEGSFNFIESPPNRQWTWSSRDHSSRRLFKNEENSLVDLGDIFPGLLERKYVFFDENASDDHVNTGSFGSIQVPHRVKVGRHLMKASLRSYKRAIVVASFVQGFYVCSLVHVMAHHLDVELQQGLQIFASAAAAALLFAPSLCNSVGAHGTLTLGCLLYSISAWCYLIGTGCTGEVKTGCERLIGNNVGISEQASDNAMVFAPLAGGAAYSFVWIGQGMMAEACLAPLAEFVDAGHRLNLSKFNLFFIGLSYAMIMIGQLVAHYGDQSDVYDMFTSLTLLSSIAAIWVGWKYKTWLRKGVERDEAELSLNDSSGAFGSGVNLMKEYRLTQAAAHRARLGELRVKMGLPSSSTSSNKNKDPAAGKWILKWNEVCVCVDVPEAVRLMFHPVMLKLLPFSLSTGLLLPLVFSQITDSIADGDLGGDAIYTVIFLAMLALLCFLIPLCKLMLENPNGRLLTLCCGQVCSLLAVLITPLMESLTKSAINDNPNARWVAIGLSTILLGVAQAVWEYAVPLTVSEFFTAEMAPFICSALSAARAQLGVSLLLGLYVSGMIKMDLYYSLGAMIVTGTISWFLLAWEMDGENEAVRTREAGYCSRAEVDWDDVESGALTKDVEDSEPEDDTENAHAKADTESNDILALPSTTVRSLVSDNDDAPGTETAHLPLDQSLLVDDDEGDDGEGDDVASSHDTINTSLPCPGAESDKLGIATTWRSADDSEDNSPVNFAERL